MTPEDVLFNRRCAGNVLRYHTWPTLQKQTVGDHTFHVIRIYMEVWPDDFRDCGVLLEYLIYHDMSEIATGDLPYPIKMKNPNLKSVMDQLERDHGYDMGRSPILLEEPYKRRAKLADLAEMYEFGKHELRLGNKMAEPICNRIWATCQGMCYVDSDPHAKFIMDYLNKVK